MDSGLKAAWEAQLRAWYHGRGINVADMQLRTRPDGRVVATCQLILPPYPHVYQNEAGQWCSEDCIWPAVD